MKNSPCSFFGGFLVFFKAVLAKPFVFVIVVHLPLCLLLTANPLHLFFVVDSPLLNTTQTHQSQALVFCCEFVFAIVALTFVSDLAHRVIRVAVFFKAVLAKPFVFVIVVPATFSVSTNGAFFIWVGVGGISVVACFFFVVLRPVLLLVLAAFGTEGNSMLLAVVATFSPANLAWIAEFGLASFAFVLSVVVLGGLDVVKVRLCSHSDCLLDCCCPIYADKIISIFFGISENPRIIK